MRSCSVAGCSRSYYAVGLCGAHYTRQRKGQSLEDRSVYEQSALEKFRGKYDVAADGCWNWRFAKTGVTPPRANTFMLDGKVMIAYRASYILHKGAIPSGALVCHTCDNGLCVNPAHLYAGSYSDNNTDTVARRRRDHTSQKGTSHTSAKLTEDDVRRIRRDMVAPVRGTFRRLTRELQISTATLQDVISGKTWKHVIID